MFRINILLALTLVAGLCMAQQPEATGYLTPMDGTPVQKITYALTGKTTTNGFEMSYLITDKNHDPIKGITIKNNKTLKNITLSIIDLKNGAEDAHYNIVYSIYGGLVINPAGDSVTFLDKTYNYLYLLSFASEKKEYLNLHVVAKAGAYSIMLTGISDSLMNLNNTILREAIMIKNLIAEQGNQQRTNSEVSQYKIDSMANVKAMAMVDARLKQLELATADKALRADGGQSGPGSDRFNDRMLLLVDSFYKTYDKALVLASACKSNINEHMSKLAPEDLKRIDEGFSQFESASFAGPQRNNRPNGTGILLSQRSLYYGQFDNGIFLEGDALIQEKAFSYIGHTVQNKYSGKGGLIWGKNKGFEYGDFSGGNFLSGIVKKVEKEIYLGWMKGNTRVGYGELIYENGSFFAGEFKDGKPYTGYIKVKDENDGSVTYYSILAGVKSPLYDQQKVKPLFDAIAKWKKEIKTEED